MLSSDDSSFDGFYDFSFASLGNDTLKKQSVLKGKNLLLESKFFPLTLLHSERPKLHRVLAVLSAIGLKVE